MLAYITSHVTASSLTVLTFVHQKVQNYNVVISTLALKTLYDSKLYRGVEKEVISPWFD